MSTSRPKKSKHHKSKLSDDLSEIKIEKKIFDKDEYDDEDDNNKKSHKKYHSSTKKRKRKRYHTKISHNKENILTNIMTQENNGKNEKDEKESKVKFDKIDIIDVECWKTLNLKMTAEENMDEL